MEIPTSSGLEELKGARGRKPRLHRLGSGTASVGVLQPKPYMYICIYIHGLGTSH